MLPRPLKRRKAISLPLKAPFPCGQHQIHSLLLSSSLPLSSSLSLHSLSLFFPSSLSLSIISFSFHLPRLLNLSPSPSPTLTLSLSSTTRSLSPFPFTLVSPFASNRPREVSSLAHPRTPRDSPLLDAPRFSRPSSLLLSAPFSSTRYARLPVASRGLLLLSLHPSSPFRPVDRHSVDNQFLASRIPLETRRELQLMIAAVAAETSLHLRPAKALPIESRSSSSCASCRDASELTSSTTLARPRGSC